MKTQSDSQHWYVLLDGQRRGPFSYAELTKAAREGIITADTNIWRSGWKNWHLAKSVKGLVPERASSPAIERPVNEAPLAPDDSESEWADEQLSAPEEEAYQYVPQQRGNARRSPDVMLRWDDHQPSPADDNTDNTDDTDHIFAEEWRTLAARPPERPAEELRGRPALPARRAPDADLDDGYGDEDYHPAPGGDAADGKTFAAQFGTLVKRAAIGLGAVVLLAGGGVILLQSGALRPKSIPGAEAAVLAPGDLPVAVASIPAVVALQRNDAAAFERFKKRFNDSAKNVHDDDWVMTLARNALRKSVKHLVAISSGDVLLELTETSLAYLQGLQATNPESCVAFSDESKGARLTSNLYKELPGPFGREMVVLEKTANTNPHTAIAPMSAQDARPYFDKVASTLVRQSVKTDLQGRDRLDPADFAPYCALVIAFYQAVLDMPRDDKVNLLRYLYATAAVNADSDLKR